MYKHIQKNIYTHKNKNIFLNKKYLSLIIMKFYYTAGFNLY